MFHFDYLTQGTCARLVSFDLEDDRIYNISFYGGCDGNLKAIAALLDGQPVDSFASRLEGITCGRKKTSCGDQLAKAIRAAQIAEKDPNYVSPLAEED